MPTWAWFLLGYFLFALAVSPFIAAVIHTSDDDDPDWP
jgi:hypothetical protein